MTKIILVDFVRKNENQKTSTHHLFDDQELFQLLCSRMRSLTGIGFRYVGTLGENLLNCPWCVTVSHSHQLILVGDYRNKRILGFNLFTRELQETIKLGQEPLSMCVEKSNEDGQDQLIVGTASSQVFKFEIEKKSVNNKVWTYSCPGYPTGLCISYGENGNEGNLIFVCDTSEESIVILNSKNGNEINRIRNIQFENNNPFRKPFAVDFNDLTKSLYVSDVNGHCLRIIKFKKKITHKTMEFSQKSFGKGGTSFCNLKIPRGISMSKKKGLIFVADEANHRIQLFDCRREEFVNSFGTFGGTNSQFRKPYSVYFDDVTETLFVADTYNCRCQIYR